MGEFCGANGDLPANLADLTVDLIKLPPFARLPGINLRWDYAPYMVTQPRILAENALVMIARQAYPALWLRLGNRWQRLGQLERATAAFQAFCDAYPQDSYGWWRLGQLYDLQNDRYKAITTYETLTEHHPTHREAWLAMMTAAIAAGEINVAEWACRRALALDWDDIQQLQRMGRYWHGQGNPPLARDCCQRALGLAPGDREVYATLVPVEAAQQQWETVERLAKAWQTLAGPKDPEPWHYLGLSYRERAIAPQAIECWRQMEERRAALEPKRRSPRDWEELAQWVEFCLVQKDDDSHTVALEQYQAIVKRETPTGAAPYRALAQLHGKAGAWAKAIAAYEQAIERSDTASKTARLYAQLGRCHSRSGHPKRAAKAYKKAISQGCQDRWVWGQYADYCYGQEQWESAAQGFGYLYRQGRTSEPLTSRKLTKIPVEQLARWGEACWRSGALEDAQVICQGLTERDPKNARGWQVLGKLYADQGDLDRAIATWTQGYDHQPAPELAWELAQAYQQQEQLEAAIAHYRECADAQLHQDEVYGALGDCFFALQRWELASEAYSQALAYGTHHPPDRYYQLGLAFMKQGRSMEAVAAYRRVLDKQPDNVDLYMELAEVYTELGWSAIAAKTYQNAIQVGYTSPEIYQKLGSVLREQESWREAATAYRNAISLAPQRGDLRAALGKIYDRQGAITEAIQAYQGSLALDPKPTWVWSQLAKLYLRNEDWCGAIATYQSATTHHPPLLLQCHKNWAKAYRQLGQPQACIELYRRAIKLFPQERDFYEALAKAQGAVKDWPAAIKTWEAAIAQLPETQNSRVRLKLELARANGRAGHWDKALSLCDQLEAIAPEDAQLYMVRGDAYRAQKQFARARQAYETALKFKGGDHCQIYLHLGQMWGTLHDDLPKALEAYHSAVQSNPKSVKGWHALAVTAHGLENWEQCAAAAAEAIARGSTDPVLYAFSAQSLIALNSPELALETIEQGLVHHPKYAPLHEQMGCAYEALGYHWRRTLSNYHRAIRLGPETSFVSIRRTSALLKKHGCWSEWLAFVLDVQIRLPKNRWLTAQQHMAVGALHRNQQDWDSAIASFIRAIQLSPDLWEAYDEIATTLHRAKRPLPPPSATSPSTFCELPPALVKEFCPHRDEQIATGLSHPSVTAFPSQDAETHILQSSGTIEGPPLPQLTETTLHIPAAYTALIPQGRAWGSQLVTATFTADNTLLSDLTTGYGELLLNVPDAPLIQAIEGTVAFLAARWSDSAYFHWMFDVMPRLGMLRNSGLTWDDIDHFAFNRCRSPFQLDGAKALGIPQSKIIHCRPMPWDGALEPLDYRIPHFRADQLLVPSIPELRCYRGARWAHQFLRDLFLTETLASVPSGAKKQCRGKKLYLHRRGLGHRQVVNGEALADLLDDRGFEAINPGGFTVQEQAQTFAAADVIVAVHGAALVNLVFCKPGTVVIEIFGPNHIQNTYWIISNVAGLKHYHLLATPMPTLEATRGVKEDLLIDVDQLRRLLETLDL